MPNKIILGVVAGIMLYFLLKVVISVLMLLIMGTATFLLIGLAFSYFRKRRSGVL